LKLRIGTRGSQLALWQAHHVAGLLRGAGNEVEIEVIKTTGDRLQEVTFAEVGTKGMFTQEIEEALAAGRVDLAVHSLKDLPTELPSGFVLAAVPKRADARDVFVSEKYGRLADLPLGARVGTSSLRRRALLRAMRPDLELMEFRGNVDTRLRKLGDGLADGILLAGAGLDRLGRTEWVRERMAVEQMVPAPGQGALGIEARDGDDAVLGALAFLEDAATRFAVTAERAALGGLGGGCQVPIGAHCRILGNGEYEILGAVGDPAGDVVLRGRQVGSSDDGAETLGRRLAEELMGMGAAGLIASVAAAAGAVGRG
jgi:hydroxymethylbilane synthase